MAWPPVADLGRWIGENPWPTAAGFVVAGVLLALLADWLFAKFMRRLARRTATKLDDKLLERLHRPVQVGVFLATMLLAAEVLLDEHSLQKPVLRVIGSALVFLACLGLVQCVRTFFTEAARNNSHRGGLRQVVPLLNNLAVVLAVLVGGYYLLTIWKINVTPLLASAGIATAVIALAAKDTVANFFGGVSILVDRPYSLGDYIDLPGGVRGEVVHIGIRSTRILTRDDVLVTIPNADMATSKIINESGQVPRYRFRAKVGVAYDSDLDVVEKALLDSLEGVPEVLANPSPRVRFREFGDSALIYELMAWVTAPADRGRVLHEVNRNIFNIFRQRGDRKSVV